MYAKNREALMLLAIYGCIASEHRPAFTLQEDAALELEDLRITAKKLNHSIVTGRAATAAAAR